MGNNPKNRRPIGYVAYYLERLRDGTEEGAKVFDRKEDALKWMGRLADRWIGGCNMEFRLFELGKEVPIEEVTEEAPQPPKVQRSFREKATGE